MTKMYIAVLDEFPDFMTPTLVAHAVLGHHDQAMDMAAPMFWQTVRYMEK